MNKYLCIEKKLHSKDKFHISLELDRIKKILDLLDNPQDKLNIIHVAGTNGKGSVCAMLNEVLILNGYKTGLYTSPHLIKYNERIKINNADITDDDFCELIEKIDELSRNNKINLTEFELLTAVMYEYFYENKVDVAVVEVGLGGKYDATNCIENPLLTVITSISLDHTERLGDTIDKIAYEKAGIIKTGVPVIFDEFNLGANVLRKAAEDIEAKICYSYSCELDKNGFNCSRNTYNLNLKGKYQEKNLGIVIKTIEILKQKGFKISNIDEAFKRVKWPCRFECIKSKNIILDGAHNSDGAKLLRESLDFYFPDNKRIFVYTSLKNKDYVTVQKMLFKDDDEVYHYDMREERFITKNDIFKKAKSIDISGLKEVIKNKNGKDLLIICGSLYALGDILGKIDLCS